MLPDGGAAGRVLLIQVGEVAPEPGGYQRATCAQIQVLVAGETVSIRTNRCARRRNGRLLGKVAALDSVVLVVVVHIGGQPAAAASTDELRQHTRIRHLRRVPCRADEHFLERAVVQIETRRRRSLRRVDAFDERAVLAKEAVGEIVRLCSGRAAADIHSRERDRGRRPEQRPHVTRVRQRCKRLAIVVGLQPCGRRVDDRRFARNRDRFLLVRHAQRDPDGGIEPERHPDAFADERAEPGQRELECTRPAGPLESDNPLLVGDGRQGADLRRRCCVDGDTRQRAADVVDNLSADTTC